LRQRQGEVAAEAKHAMIMKDLVPQGGSGADLWMVTGCRASRVMEAGAHHPRKTGVRAHNPRTTHRRQ